jgi:hypothetical protein
MRLTVGVGSRKNRNQKTLQKKNARLMPVTCDYAKYTNILNTK